MPTLSEAKIPDSTPEQRREGAAGRRWTLRPPRKAFAAVLAAGLAVPRIEASFFREPSVLSTLAGLERDYKELAQKISRLRAHPEVASTFKTLLYVEQATDRFLPQTWASLPGDRFPDDPHRYLLVQRHFLDFLTSRDATGHPLVSASDAVRVYGSALVASRVFHIPPSLLLCLLLQESRLRTSAVSPTGAEGVGQLTEPGLEQVDSLLSSSRWRERLRLFEETMARLYSDPEGRLVLSKLVPDLRLPVFSKINRVERSWVSEPLLRRVVVLLERKRPELASNQELLRSLCAELRAGRPVDARYEPVARAYRIAATELYNVQTGNTFNPETNVVVSAMLFRHYIHYPWSLEGRRLTLPFPLRCALAVLAYNQGPRAAARILRHIGQTGLLELDELSMERLREVYTEELVREAVGAAGMRPEELYRHFDSIMGCALASKPVAPVQAAKKPGAPAQAANPPAAAAAR
jgi:hypothetical protein